MPDVGHGVHMQKPGNAVTAPTGHPMQECAKSQRPHEVSTKADIGESHHTELTIKITKPVARIGKMYLALPSMLPALPRGDLARKVRPDQGVASWLMHRLQSRAVMLEQSLKEFLALLRMTRGVRWYLVSSLVLGAFIALAGCSHYMLAEREPWRHEAELACLNSGAVKESPARVRISAVNGAGACGIEYPIKVSALGGDGPPLAYDEDAIRPPGSIPDRGYAAALARRPALPAAPSTQAHCRHCTAPSRPIPSRDTVAAPRHRNSIRGTRSPASRCRSAAQPRPQPGSRCRHPGPRPA